MKKTYEWLQADVLRAANAALVDRFGGMQGPCKENLLLSALDRPENLLAYGNNPSIFDLAAAYGYAIVKNHPFSDGNKRVALMAMQSFLDINNWELKAPQPEAVAIMIALASSEIGEKEVAAWLKKNSVKIKVTKTKSSA
jgi:death on curing protein